MLREQNLDEKDAPKSRSQKKRDSSALQKRGEEIAALPPSIWRELPLTEDLLAAFMELKTMKTREAKRRHQQCIGRLMREMDNGKLEELLEALGALKDGSRDKNEFFKSVEEMRNTLLAPDPTQRESALARYTVKYPALEATRLRHLAEAAIMDKEKQRPPKHSRELFRYLHKVIASSQTKWHLPE